MNNIWLWSPQRQVSLKKYGFDHLKHGWRWSAFPRKIYRFCAHKNSWKLSWSLLEYSRFWSPQTLLEMSLGPLKAHLVLSPQTRLEMSTGDHHKHGDGPTSHEKHPVLVATKTAGNVQRCPLKKLFFFSHEHRWRWPNYLIYRLVCNTFVWPTCADRFWMIALFGVELWFPLILSGRLISLKKTLLRPLVLCSRCFLLTAWEQYIPVRLALGRSL